MSAITTLNMLTQANNAWRPLRSDTQDDVEQHDPGAQAELQMARLGMPEREEHVVPEESGDDEHCVEEIPMEVVQDQRELRLAPVLLVAQLPHRACRWIPEEGAVVRLAVVVAGG